MIAARTITMVSFAWQLSLFHPNVALYQLLFRLLFVHTSWKTFLSIEGK